MTQGNKEEQDSEWNKIAWGDRRVGKKHKSVRLHSRIVCVAYLNYFTAPQTGLGLGWSRWTLYVSIIDNGLLRSARNQQGREISRTSRAHDCPHEAIWKLSAAGPLYKSSKCSSIWQSIRTGSILSQWASGYSLRGNDPSVRCLLLTTTTPFAAVQQIYFVKILRFLSSYAVRTANPTRGPQSPQSPHGLWDAQCDEDIERHADAALAATAEALRHAESRASLVTTTTTTAVASSEPEQSPDRVTIFAIAAIVGALLCFIAIGILGGVLSRRRHSIQ